MNGEEYICVLCPNGCKLTLEIDDGPPAVIKNIQGERCTKGIEWVREEVINPKRVLTGSIRVLNGDYPLVNARTDRPIPLERLRDVMGIIRETVVTAPVLIGDVLIDKPAGVDCQVIAARNVRSV